MQYPSSYLFPSICITQNAKDSTPLSNQSTFCFRLGYWTMKQQIVQTALLHSSQSGTEKPIVYHLPRFHHCLCWFTFSIEDVMTPMDWGSDSSWCSRLVMAAGNGVFVFISLLLPHNTMYSPLTISNPPRTLSFSDAYIYLANTELVKPE